KHVTIQGPFPDLSPASPFGLPTGCQDLQIRRSGQVVQGRLSWSVRWADIPQLSNRYRGRPSAWQQYWQQSRRNRTYPDLVRARPARAQADAEDKADARPSTAEASRAGQVPRRPDRTARNR